jgi:hypothetical protein
MANSRNLGQVDLASGSTLNGAPISTGAGGSHYVMAFGGAVTAGQYFLANNNGAGAGASDYSTRGVAPIASTISFIGWAANGADTIDIRYNGALLQSFAVVNGQGTFPVIAQAFAAGDYVELVSPAGIGASFQVLFTVP